MVHVRDMSVTVPHPRMPMHMRVRFAGRIVWLMHMLMMGVVHMRVAVLQRLVYVFVVVIFG